ncbi:DUF2336 domain-containing protein [Sneathiella sp.]|jgi:uncharacterized protein (DUF2336 family)|uniref:DUF2336 domain-containing protein n=1 Tax=Sneathiella sp. TaxID=1964365 RepID=UPI0039E60007
MHYRDPNIGERIENLFSTMTVSSRVTTARTVAHDFASGTMEADDYKLAEQLLTFLVNDIEEDVRQAIAEQVQSYHDLPKEIAMQLAMDINSVSLPILKNSTVLEDRILIQILKYAEDIRQVAIASRSELSETVTDAIAEFGCYDAIVTCLENETATIGRHGFNNIIIRFTHDDEIHELIVKRPHLPTETINQLSHIISEELKEQLFQSYPIPEEVATRMMTNAQEKTLYDQIKRRNSLIDKQKAGRQLFADGRLSPTLILRSLLENDLTFFTIGLSLVSGISVRRVTALVSDRGPLGLKRLYEKAELPPYLYLAFKTALQESAKLKSQHPHSNVRNKQGIMIQKIARAYNFDEAISMENLLEKLLPHPNIPNGKSL